MTQGDLNRGSEAILMLMRLCRMHRASLYEPQSPQSAGVNKRQKSRIMKKNCQQKYQINKQVEQIQLNIPGRSVDSEPKTRNIKTQ